MKNYKTDCLICDKSVSDPEYGYSCSLGLWDYYPHKALQCPKYNIDIDCLQKELDEFVKLEQDRILKMNGGDYD